MTLDVRDTDGTVTVRQDGVTLVRYRAETAASKPHVETLALPAGAEPAGRNLVLAAPHDHAWHLGLFFCQKLVDGLNCWESERNAAEGRPYGHAVPEGYDVATDGGTVTIEQAVGWESDAGERLLGDERRLRIHTPESGGYLVGWEQSLEARDGRRHLSSETIHGHYSGLSARFARDLTGGRIRLPDAENPADERGPAGAWCDYTGPLDGKVGAGEQWAAGVTLMDHPDNDPHPVRWFATREPFGFVSANPTWATVRTLDPGERVTWRWGAWVHAGEPERGEIEAAYDRFRDAFGVDQ